MSKYVHPFQKEFDQKINYIISKYRSSKIEIQSIISLLADNNIQFFSRDDLTKFTKISKPFDQVALKQALSFLEFVCVHTYLQSKYFIVKFAGRSNKILNVKQSSLKKLQHSHSITNCITDFRKKLLKCSSSEMFWFRLLGGVLGTNDIKTDALRKRIHKILANTCHSSCLDQIYAYFIQHKSDTTIKWQIIRQKILNKPLKKCLDIVKDLQKKQDFQISIKQSNQPGASVMEAERINQSRKQLQTSSKTQDTKQMNKQNTLQRETRPRRLKTLHAQPKYMIESSHNFEINFNEECQQAIHSKKHKVKHRVLVSPLKKTKSSLNVYQYN